MQKNFLLSIVGVAALTLLGACGGGPAKEEPVAVHQEEKQGDATTAMGDVAGDTELQRENVAVADLGGMSDSGTSDDGSQQQVASAEIPDQEQKA